eukprot:SM000099S25232  [mRNA]  locus=s99:349159:351669:- [translate_table: standard]
MRDAAGRQQGTERHIGEPNRGGQARRLKDAGQMFITCKSSRYETPLKYRLSQNPAIYVVEMVLMLLEESSGVAGLQEGATIPDVVRKVKPDALLGLSGVGRIFTQEVLEGMRHDGNPRPAIIAMSNPTSNAECTSEEAFRHAGPHVIFASGSPFDDVPLEGGEVGHANQGNNMCLFPGIGLGALLSGARTISDEMLHAAAERLPAFMSEEDLRQGIIFPPLVREITREVATAVVRKAVEEDLAEGYRETNLKILSRMTEARFLQLNEIQHP